MVASYLYDSWGALTSSTESFASGWTNPYRYDGRDGVRYDAATGLYWLAVRAYDPTLGRFLSRDPLGRAPLFVGNDNPYVYAGDNPLSNVDPSGQYRAAGQGAGVQAEDWTATKQHMARVQTTNAQMATYYYALGLIPYQHVQAIASHASGYFDTMAGGIDDFAVGLAIALGGAMLLFGANPEFLMVGGFLLGLGSSFGLLKYELSDLSNMFHDEANHADTWFTLANIEDFQNSLSTQMEHHLYGLLAVLGTILAVLPWVKEAAVAAESAFALTGFAFILGLLDRVPEMAMAAKDAMNFVRSEEQVWMA